MGINSLGSAFRSPTWQPEPKPDIKPEVDPQPQQQPATSTKPSFYTSNKTQVGDAGGGGQADAVDSPSISLSDHTEGKTKKSIDKDLALLAADVYETDTSAVTGPSGTTWTPVSDADLEAAGIDPALLGSDETTFKAEVYADGQGNYVVAYAGTEDAGDWMENIEQLTGDSEQYDEAVALAQAVTEAYGADNVVTTGHSLGGGLATLAALATGTNAVTFNPVGISDDTFESHGLVPDQARVDAKDGQVRAYAVESEVLTTTQDTSPLPDTVGTKLVLDDPHPVDIEDYKSPYPYQGAYEQYLAAEALDSIKDHSMDTVLESLGIEE